MKLSLRGAVIFIAALLFAMGITVTASETNPNTYIYVPVKEGADATALFSNSNADSGTDATITEDGNGGASLDFGTGVAGWKRTVVDLDISDVANERYKYISFDITLEELMNLVISLDPYDVSQNLDNRPHSLYFTDTGYMAPTQHSRKQKYISKTDADGYNSAITSSWWINTEKITQPYSPNTPINVTIIASSVTGIATPLSNGAKRFESDEVQIYINGVRKGQLITANRLDSWNSNVLSFSHYSDSGNGGKIYLDNLEIGYCREQGLDEINVLNPDEADKTWEFPEGNNVFITMTLPTGGENAYHIQTDIGNDVAMQWFKDMGVVANWANNVFKADGSCSMSYKDILSWRNIHAWKNSDEVTITFVIDKNHGTVSLYDSLGHWRKAYCEIPTSVTITDIVGNVVPTKVVSGVLVSKGLWITDENNKSVKAFDSSTGPIYAATFGRTEEIPMVIYAWYDVDGDLLEAKTVELETDEDGIFVLSSFSGVGITPPKGAASLKVFSWDNLIRPLYDSKSIDKATAEYENVKFYEVPENGRYRVYGNMDFADSVCNGNVLTVSHNGRKVWEQLIVAGEEQILDIRIFAKAGDEIQVGVEKEISNDYDYSLWNCDISRYLGVLYNCEASTSVGYSYKIRKKMTFGSLIGSEQGANGSEFYSLKFGVKHPMKYDSASGKWRSSISGDDGAIGATTVVPGTEWTVGADSIMEYTVPNSGTLRLDGDFYIYDEKSDGVLANVYINDKLWWSNRVGGARTVRWDEPFDVSYFLDKANVVANVEKGDVIKFVFNRWRKSGRDWLSTENVTLNYIRGDVLSETTKWKISRSIAVDAVSGVAYRDDIKRNVDIIFENGKFYITEGSVFGVFGEIPENRVEAVEINGVPYLPLKELAEANGKYTAEVDDKMILIHENIPVFYGFPEISEIRTALENGESLF